MYSCKYLSFSRGKSDMDLLARRVVQELEGDEGQKHLDEYADSSTERGKCLLKSICEQMGFDSLGYQSIEGHERGHRHRSREDLHVLLGRQGVNRDTRS